MSRRLLTMVVVLALFDCGNRESGKREPDRPLAEAILGEWEVWCRSDDEATTTCLGREDAGLFKVFRPGGELSAGATRGTTMAGRWHLTDDRLVLEFEGGGLRLTEEYRARIADDRLVLWNPQQGWGVIHGRKGAGFAAAPSPVTDGAPISSELNGVRYSLTLPAGYRLVRDDNQRRSYGPRSGDGFVVKLVVSPRVQTEIDGRWITPPCNDRDYGGVSGSSETIDGVERDTSIGTSLCVGATDLVLLCSTEHSRGYLEAAEKDAALALCRSLELLR